MTLTKDERLRELYRELNVDHSAQREALLRQLPANATSDTNFGFTTSTPPRHNLRPWWITSGVAAAVVLVAGIFALRPTDAWAEVVKAVRSQKWIHLVRIDMDGNVTEEWESPSGATSAAKSSSEIRLVDKQTSLMQVYYPNQNKLVRLELNDQEPIDSMKLFIDLLLGNSDRLRHLKVLNRQHRSVMEHGQSWNEICLTVQPIGGTTMIWISKIDPKTHLPRTFRVEIPDRVELVNNLPEARFDYPAEGPLTLVALGVPDDAILEDRVPKDSLKNIMAKMKEQRMKLGAYHLQLFYGTTSQISRESWKDGNKWRQDHESPDICDGQESWSKHMGYWQMIKKFPNEPTDEFCKLNSQWHYLENLTYPFLSATPEFDLTVRPNSTDGPDGCILVERVATVGANPNLVHRYTPRLEQYWLDPNRNFALVKRVRTNVEASEAECHSKGIPKHTETTYSDFEQSPSGVWYPTTVKTTGTIWVKQINPMIVQPLDQHWRVKAEFHEALPNDLFDIKAAQKRSP